jgi:cyclopropane fatty-acyl-phospholipid synthase-like methyltransferase
MPTVDDVLSVNVISQAAERELAAFLRATTDIFGHAGEIWIHAMESRDWHCENPDKFFRGVTVHAVAQICSHFGLSDQPKV